MKLTFNFRDAKQSSEKRRIVSTAVRRSFRQIRS